MKNEIVTLTEEEKMLYAGSQDTGETDDLYLPTAYVGNPQNEMVIDGKIPQGAIANSLTDSVIVEPGEKGVFIPLLKYTEYSYNPTDDEKEHGWKFWITRDPSAEVIVPNKDGERIETTALEAVQWNDGNKPLADKSLVFLVVFESDPNMPVIIKFKRTNFTSGKKLNTLLRLSSDPRYFTKRFDISLEKKKGERGVWYNYVIDAAGETPPELVEKLTATFKNYVGLRDGFQTFKTKSED